MSKFFTIGLLALIAIAGHTQTCYPIDMSFGVGGKAVGHTISSGNIGSPNSQNIIVQPDNKIIQIANISESGYTYKFAIIRFTSNGLPDASFGTNGKVITSVGTDYGYAEAGAMQPDGKIIVVGNASNGINSDFALVRYNADGTLDNSFGTGGIVLTPVGQYNDNAVELSIQSDGKIVVVGSSDDNTYRIPAFAVVRYNSNGSIDNSFGSNGRIVTHLGHFITYLGGNYYGTYSYEGANSVGIQADGKIVVAGQSYTYNGCYDYYGGVYCNPAMAIVRYNSNGSPDLSFGNGGKVVDSVSLIYPASTLLQPDGRIVVTGGGTGNGFTTKRYNSDGSPDLGFGINGLVFTSLGGINTYGAGNSMLVQPDGKIAVAGYSNSNNSGDFAVARYQSNGSLDNSFNIGGIAIFHTGPQGTNEGATGVAIQGNKLLVAGWSRYNPNSDIIVVRLNDSPSSFQVPITPDGPIIFCQGGGVNLTTNATGTLQWFNNGSVIIGATTSSYRATVTGNYSLAVINSNGCGVSNSIAVSVTAFPAKPVISQGGPLVFCDGGNVTLNASGSGNMQWAKDGTALSGATNSSYTASISGSYTVVATNPPGCSITSNPVVVAAKSISVPTVSPAGPINFCIGLNNVLTTTTTDFPQWYKNGNLIAGAILSSYTVTTSGTYSESNGCANSNSVLVTVNNNPPKPSINWNINTLVLSTTPGYSGYQWYLNNSVIAGATSDVYSPPLAQIGTLPGLYKVQVTDLNNCRNSSDEFNLAITSSTDIIIAGITFHYYPNPASKELYVDMSQPIGSKFIARLYDISGRLLQTQSLDQRHNIIPVEKLASGLYQLVIHNDKGKAGRKVMVIK